MIFPKPDRRAFILSGAAGLLLPSCASVAVAPPLPRRLNWEKLPTEPYAGKQDDIAFANTSRGWFGNGKGLLYRTDDAGNSWTKVWEQPGTFIRALGFLDERRGILGNVGVGSFPGVTDETPLYHSADAGDSWQAAAISGPVPQGICAIDIVRAAFIDRGERAERTIAHAAGRVGGPAHYLRSADGGQSWRSADLTGQTAAIFDVKFLSPKIGFIAGTSDSDLAQTRGLILRTDDGGDSWREVFRSRRPVETVWKLHFPDGQTGYGTIQSYDPDPANIQRYVVKTTDGGRNWEELPLIADAKWRSFGVGFADRETGWVGGNLGGLETRDGGLTWAPVEMGKAVNKIRFAGKGEDRLAFAIGSEVHRLKL